MSIFIFFFTSFLMIETAEQIFTKIFQDDGKRAAIEKLSFWFLNSFVAGRTQPHKTQHGGKTDLLIEESCVISAG